MKAFYILILSGFISYQLFAQTPLVLKPMPPNLKEAKVSFFKDTPIHFFINKIDSLTEKFEHKKIVFKDSIYGKIGRDIEQQPYRLALQNIAKYNNINIRENDSTITLQKIKNDPLDDRQVNISAIFFEANVTQMRERGVNWEELLSKAGLIIDPVLTTGQQAELQRDLGPNFKLKMQTAGDVGKFSSYTNFLLSLFENENLGRVLAKLSLTVRDGRKGRIQIGSDFSVKQFDFAGNVIDRFYPTGTIIDVTPHIHKEDSLYYANLDLDVEKSIFEPNTVNNQIKKETAHTDVLLYNHQEAIVGSLLTSEVVNTRGGIPVLKDLPWWVFGLRYLTGYSQKQVVEKEVIILVKINILPTLREQIKTAGENVLQQKINEDREELKKFEMKNNGYHRIKKK